MVPPSLDWRIVVLMAAGFAPVLCGAVVMAEEKAFTERSVLSALDVQRMRYGLAGDGGNVYEIGAERFSVLVPDSYDGKAGWGLLVWCSPGDGAEMPRGWGELLAKKKLIWVSARNAGNRRAVGVRVGLALDAVHNLRGRYKLDEKRMYIGGVSGGAKVAEMAAMAYPDVFDGAICCVGVNWYKDVPVPSRPNTAWPATFRRPPNDVFTDARDNVGFILVTGDNDDNHEPIVTMYEKGFVADKFKHAILHDVPGMGHGAPAIELLEKAIDELEALPKGRVKKSHGPTPRPLTRAVTTRSSTRPSR
jgi:hypothetical protein